MRSLIQGWFLNLVIRGAQSLYPTGVVAVSETLRRPLGILLMPSESLADTLHALPVARALRRAFPDTRISMMTRAESSDLVKDAPGLDEAILCYPLDHPWSWKAFRQTVAEVRTRNFDALFSLDHEHDPVKAVVGYLSGARVRVAHGDCERRDLFNVLVDPPRESAYLATRGLGLLSAVGIDTDDIGGEWFPPEAEWKIADQLVELRGLREGRILAGFESTASQRGGSPPLARYGPALKEHLGARFVVVQEAPPAAYSYQRSLTPLDHGEDMACRTIRDVLAILACCDVFLCKNTNLLHFAVAMGVPTVAFLPPGMPAPLTPPESDRLMIVRDDLTDENLCRRVGRLVQHRYAGRPATEGKT